MGVGSLYSTREELEGREPKPSILRSTVRFSAACSGVKAISSNVLIGGGISPPDTEMCMRLRNSFNSSPLGLTQQTRPFTI